MKSRHNLYETQGMSNCYKRPKDRPRDAKKNETYEENERIYFNNDLFQEIGFWNRKYRHSETLSVDY